jgi:hypothetical protein
VIRVKKGRRRKYYLQPKKAGPSVGWQDWIHGKAKLLTAFQRWFLGEDLPVNPKSPDFRKQLEAIDSQSAMLDNTVNDCTRETANIVRAENGLRASWARSSKEVMEAKLKIFFEIDQTHWVKFNDTHGMIWSTGDYYIVQRMLDGTVWRSTRMKRDEAYKRWQRDTVVWQKKTTMVELLR